MYRDLISPPPYLTRIPSPWPLVLGQPGGAAVMVTWVQRSDIVYFYTPTRVGFMDDPYPTVITVIFS
jgi:hypothetical protein